MIRSYMVIFPVDFDGSIEVDKHTFTGTYEDVADAIVNCVDKHVDRGVDGMALEAWLIVGEVGTVHTVCQDERPVCVVVRVAE